MVMSKILGLLLAYRYPILIPFAIFEGPITSVIAGLLISTGLMNPLIVYVIVVISDAIGDAMFYSIGYHGGFLRKYGPRFGITKEKIDRAEDYFKENHQKSIILSKLIQGIGFTGLIAAGSLKIPYKRYFKTCFSMSLIQSAFYLILGIFFGGAYMQISKYLNYFAALASIAALVVIIIILYKRVSVKKFRGKKKI